MKKRKQYDLNASDTQTLREEINQGAFIAQGSMIAFPLCFPGASTPIPQDESFITALDVSHDGMVYGGTSGRRAHLFVGMFHGSRGAIFDMGVVEGADSCVAICCGEKKLMAFLNGPGGGRAVRCDLYRMPDQLLQEWCFMRGQIENLGEPVTGERIIHAVADGNREVTIAATEHHLVTVDFDSGEMRTVGEVETAGQLACSRKGTIFGFGKSGHLWCFSPECNALTREAVPLPDGDWDESRLRWAPGDRGLPLYTADNDGRLFAFDENGGFKGPLGKAPLVPVGPMAVTFDGRLFGFCGTGISRMFTYDPATGETVDLGVAVSFFERRRYGYVFEDAVTGRDGQIFFGEADNLGHLWIYFPRIKKAQA